MKSQIVIIVWNQLEVTKKCLEGVISKTKTPFEIILIDNASEEKTASFLKEFSLRCKTKVKLIRNDSNLGFVKAANQGLRACEADFVCLLNNDTLVTQGWLDELIATLDSNPPIGLLNPSSNTLGQKVNPKDIDSYAESLRKYRTQFEEMAQVTGFCMLIRREVIEKIGIFNEIYGMGNFEDTDYSRRAVKAGFMCGRAKASYVYHYEGTSFFKLTNHDESFKKNQAIFYQKWGKPKRIFIEAKKELLPGESNKVLSLARDGHLVFVAKEKGINLISFKHSNIKIFSFKKAFFEISCFFEILKRIKKKYNYLLIQTPLLKTLLTFLKVFHKAEIINLRKLRRLEI